MGASLKSNLLLFVALNSLVICGLSSARAEDTAGEIAALKAELRRLEARVAAQDRQSKQTRTVVQEVVGRQVYTKSALPVLASTCPPDKLCYKGITFTPGGFAAMETVFREHHLGADVATPYGNITFPITRSYHQQELRFSARQSRISGLVEGNVDPATKLSGYGEFDFLGAAQTANSNESNSYNPRIRHLYATIDQSDWGFHVLAGQTWSLATMHNIGIQTRKENIPLTIDAQYVPGFIWARQPQIRVIKDFGPDFHVAASLENPQTTVGGTVPANLAINVQPIGGGLYNQALTAVNLPAGGTLTSNSNTISFEHAPDVVVKAAWDPMFLDRTIHIEGFGVGRDFYGRYVNAVRDTYAGFAGGSVLIPVLPKVFDVQFSGAIGEGIGRYGTSQLPDVTANAAGNIKPLPEFALLAGATFHATKALDIYAYAGEEQVERKVFPTVGGVNYGYGNPANSNAGCEIEGSALACTGNARRIEQATIGVWYNFYDGRFGQLRGGAQYSYTQKTAFSDAAGRAPKTDDNIVLTSLRYYPF